MALCRCSSRCCSSQCCGTMSLQLALLRRYNAVSLQLVLLWRCGTMSLQLVLLWCCGVDVVLQHCNLQCCNAVVLWRCRTCVVVHDDGQSCFFLKLDSGSFESLQGSSCVREREIKGGEREGGGEFTHLFQDTSFPFDLILPSSVPSSSWLPEV